MEHLYVSKEVTDIVNLAEAEVRSEFDKINKLFCIKFISLFI